MKKVCRECLIEKELSEYYVHKQMGDGHLNICKECKRIYAGNQYDIKMQDLNWKIGERKRTRERNKRLEYGEKYKVLPKSKKKAIDLYFEKYPEKKKAHSLSGNIKVPEGKQKHHWSYNEEHYKDVIFLSMDNHYKLHCYIKYFQPARMYKTIFGEPLYTKDRFVKFMDFVLTNSHDAIINNFYKNNQL